MTALPQRGRPDTAPPQRLPDATQPPSKLPRGSSDLRLPDATRPPSKLPRGSSGMRPLPGSLRQAPLGSQPPNAVVRATGPTPEELADGGPIRTLVFAPEPTRARWIESELTQSNATVLEGDEPRPRITIQVGRRVRTVVFALLKDPPPRPQVLIVDFDAVSPGELFELHAIRHEGWTGRLIGLGVVPDELVTSLEIDRVFTAPFVRDSLLDCVAGTRHAAVTITIPVIPLGEEF